MRSTLSTMTAACAVLLVAGLASGQCREGSTSCDELEIQKGRETIARFSRESLVKLQDECLYQYFYDIYVDTFDKSISVGGTYVSKTGYGVTIKPGNFKASGCELLGSVTFTCRRIPKVEATSFSAEASGIVGMLPEVKICVPGDPCPEKKEKAAGGHKQMGPDDAGAHLDFLSIYTPGQGSVVYIVTNSGERVVSYDWAGLRERGVGDMRGVLAPGEQAFMQVPAQDASEEFLVLDTDFEDMGGLVASVATVVPRQQQPCYPDCDRNGRLDIRDFFCFQAAFAGGGTYADCDGNGRLDIRDFFCFQQKYAQGCP